jgi:hypothetical protein
VPRLCVLYPGIWLTIEEKARKNLSKGSRRMPVSKGYTEQSILTGINKNNSSNICDLKYLILNPMDVKWDVSLCSLVVKCQYTRFHIPDGCHYLVWRCRTPTLTRYLLIASFLIAGTRWTGSCEDLEVGIEVVDKKKMFLMLISQNFIFFWPYILV